MLTAGQMITDALRFYVNIGSGAQVFDPELRLRAQFFLRSTMAEVWNWAPFSFRHQDSSAVVAAANTGIAPMPSNFSGPGTQTQVLANNGAQPYPLNYEQEGALKARVAMYPNTGNTPVFYTWMQFTIAGLRQMQIWPIPSSNVSLIVKSYNARCLDPIDFPARPTVATNGAGVLTGAYRWRCTFTWADGETEGGYESVSTTLATNQVTVTVPVSESRYVTGVNLYRTVVGGNSFFLVDSLVVPDDVIFVNQVASVRFTDNTTDTDLGVACPLPADAITGVEQFPDDFHENVLVEGLKMHLATSQGDMRDAQWLQVFKRNVKRLWAEQKPSQSTAFGMPAYGQGPMGYDIRSRIPPGG